MLKRNSSRAIAIILVALALIWLHLLFDRPPPSKNQANHSTEDNVDPNSTDVEIASATVWLAIFTAVLAASTILMWSATRETAKIAKQGLVDKERPFVFPPEMKVTLVSHAVTGEAVKWNFSIVWEDSGSMPAMSVNTYTARTLSCAPLPDKFSFVEPSTKLAKTIIGPHASIETVPIPVRREELELIRREQQYLYFWGWVEYDDIFPDTPRHRTEFCRQITIHGDPGNPATISFSFVTHFAHNGADTECTNEVRTGSPKNPKT